MIEHAASLVAMAVLMLCSAFFSASEAALFYLSPKHLRRFATGTAAQRTAAGLLQDPERLLGAVLFWNLIVNFGYFTLSSIVATQLEGAAAGLFTVGSLVAIIVFSEMLPKNVAVLNPSAIAALVGVPLAVTVRAVDPILPILRGVNLYSRRLLFPNFKAESYLELTDLERAVELSSDAQQREQERTLLQNVVALSDLTVEELMRPRPHIRLFTPPVSLEALNGVMPPSGYLVVTEPDSDEIAAALPFRHTAVLQSKHLEHLANEVVYVPWTASVATALELMHKKERDVAAVVNEFGETIGIVTYDDILHTLFSDSPSRSARLLHRQPIAEIAPGTWRVMGMTNLRRLSRFFGQEFPSTRSATIGGLVQEVLERFPEQGDQMEWGGFQIEVSEAPEQGPIVVILRRIEVQEEAS